MELLDAVWLIPALPLAGFLTLVVAGRKLGEPLAGWLATSAIAGAFVATAVVFVELLGRSIFTDFLLPFEVTAVLLVIAVVGAVVLARRPPRFLEDADDEGVVRAK